MHKSKSSTLPSNLPEDTIPDSFCKFFQDKIDKIQHTFTSTEDLPIRPSRQLEAMLHDFAPATPEEIHKLILSSPTKSCSLDPIPTFLLKDCLKELVPAITNIINISLQTATVPYSYKTAVVTPLLKKPNLDSDELGNYRPVSNLSFTYKLLEKVVSKRLIKHKDTHDLNEPFQSAYRSGHSTETAVTRVQNDILREIDSGKCVFLVLLDLSAAFDTVSHDILLERRVSLKYSTVP